MLMLKSFDASNVLRLFHNIEAGEHDVFCGAVYNHHGIVTSKSLDVKSLRLWKPHIQWLKQYLEYQSCLIFNILVTYLITIVSILLQSVLPNKKRTPYRCLRSN